MNIQILNDKIDKYCEENKIMGMLSVRHGGKIIYERNMGYADLETKAPFTKDSRFVFYSLSKSLCAMGLMKLYDKGLIDLNAHPSKYVPECEGFDPAVTIHTVLNHTSGIPDFLTSKGFAEKYAPGTPSRIREQLKILTEYPQEFAPGTQGLYSNVNFNIAALIIENVSGMPYPEYMEKEIFRPLGMTSTFVNSGERTEPIPNLVTGYELIDGEITPHPPATDWMLGGGDIIGTLSDVYNLNLAIKNKLILNPKTWELVLTPSPINTFGYGCFIVKWHGKTRVNHNGGHKGFRTLHLQLLEDDFDIILLSNSGFGAARADIPEMLYEEFFTSEGVDAIKVEMDKGYI